MLMVGSVSGGVGELKKCKIQSIAIISMSLEPTFLMDGKILKKIFFLKDGIEFRNWLMKLFQLDG